MNEPYFKNAPLDVQFVGGDPELLRKVQTVELGILGDRDLADRLNYALAHSESGIFGFSVQEEPLDLGKKQLASSN